jgi:acyl-CoA thioesterase-1
LAANFSSAGARPVKILAMGTSLTQGYGLPPGTELTTQLQAALKAQGIDAQIVNAGVSGDTSSGGLSRLDWSLADHPDAAILELGSNDMLRGVSPAVTEKNLRAILSTLQKDHVPVLFTGMHAQRNLGADYVKEFDAIYPRLAKDGNVLFYPFILDGVALNPELNQADGMHPNPAGVKIIVARMLPYVKKLVK